MASTLHRGPNLVAFMAMIRRIVSDFCHEEDEVRTYCILHGQETKQYNFCKQLINGTVRRDDLTARKLC